MSDWFGSFLLYRSLSIRFYDVALQRMVAEILGRPLASIANKYVNNAKVYKICIVTPTVVQDSINSAKTFVFNYVVLSDAHLTYPPCCRSKTTPEPICP